eukprot:6128689-Pyramimonas_sp.AAC.1
MIWLQGKSGPLRAGTGRGRMRSHMVCVRTSCFRDTARQTWVLKGLGAQVDTATYSQISAEAIT